MNSELKNSSMLNSMQFNSTQKNSANISAFRMPDNPYYLHNADNGTFAGGTTSALTDLTGNGRVYAQTGGAAQPTQSLNALNGRSILIFNGTSMFMDMAFGATVAQPFTVMLMLRQWGSLAATQRYLDSVSSTTLRQTVISAADGTDLSINSGGTITYLDLTLNFNWSVFHFIFNGANSATYMDGALVASGNAGTNSNSTFRLGATRGTAANFAKIEYATDAGYARVLTLDEITQQTMLSKSIYAV